MSKTERDLLIMLAQITSEQMIYGKPRNTEVKNKLDGLIKQAEKEREYLEERGMVSKVL